jgi:hypothetical protein
MYLTLSKHAKISRSSDAIDGMELDFLNDGMISDSLNKGIFIDQIRIGSLETRKRSDQEIIYVITLTVDVLTEWFQDFPADTITDITLLIKTFLGTEFENAWNSSEI